MFRHVTVCFSEPTEAALDSIHLDFISSGFSGDRVLFNSASSSLLGSLVTSPTFTTEVTTVGSTGGIM